MLFELNLNKHVLKIFRLYYSTYRFFLPAGGDGKIMLGPLCVALLKMTVLNKVFLCEFIIHKKHLNENGCCFDNTFKHFGANKT